MDRVRTAAARLGGALLLLAPLHAAVAPGTTLHAAAAPVGETRIGFTADRDHLSIVPLDRTPASPTGGDPGPPSWDGAFVDLDTGARHAAEASSSPGVSQPPVTAYVATAPLRADSGPPDPDGEVFWHISHGPDGGNETVPVTCGNDAVETHPVPSPDRNWVAWASDIDGDFDLYVATRLEEGVADTVVGGACPGWQAHRVTNDAGADLWPAWVDDTRLVFSSTRDDPLGDIYLARLSGLAFDEPFDMAELVRQTDDPGADTQPTVIRSSDPDFVDDFSSQLSVSCNDDVTAPPSLVFTSTRERVTGSLFTLSLRGSIDAYDAGFTAGSQAAQDQTPYPCNYLDQPTSLAYVRGFDDAWREGNDLEGGGRRGPVPAAHPVAGSGIGTGQGSEPAWSAGFEAGYLAWTSTDEDPAGDVWVAHLTWNEQGIPEVEDAFGAADELGVRESHPTWRDTFDDVPSPELFRPAPFARPARQAATVVVPLDPPPPPTDPIPPAPEGTDDADRAELFVSVHAEDTDIADIRPDGSDRTVRVARSGTVLPPENEVPYAEAQPDYSPDATRMVFSSSTEEGPERVIMVANADGTGVRSLAEATGHEFRDIDVDPVWSPDGTRIAFTRYHYRSSFESHGPPQVWVVDLAGEEPSARRVTRAPEGFVYADRHPSWSPDGEWLVVSRRTRDIGAGATAIFPFGPSQLWVVDPDDGTRDAPLRLEYRCNGDSCRSGVRGTAPEWSPDGTRIAYSDRDALRLVTVPLTGPSDEDLAEGRWVVTGAAAVTGFTDEVFLTGQDGPPTPSRDRISAATDPAWRPDGRRIAFTGQPAGQPDQRGTWTIRPDGTGLRLVTAGRGPERHPAWRAPVQADVAVELTLSGATAPGEPVVATFTVRNLGPSPARDVDLATAYPPGAVIDVDAAPPGCRSDGTGCTLPTLAPGATVEYPVTFTWPEPVNGLVVGTVSSGTHDPVPGNNRAARDVRLVAPATDVRVRVRLDEPVGYVGGERRATVTVRNLGAEPAETVRLVLALPAAVEPLSVDPGPGSDCLLAGTRCALGTLAPGARRSFEVVLGMRRQATRRINAEVSTSTVDERPANDTDEVRLEILRPRIRLLPSVARPGMVVLAFGEQMPPGSRVRLRWSEGVTVDPGPYRVDEDGTMTASLLVVRRNLLGERQLVATSTTDEFSPVEGDLLVTLPLMNAPNFLGRG